MSRAHAREAVRRAQTMLEAPHPGRMGTPGEWFLYATTLKRTLQETTDVLADRLDREEGRIDCQHEGVPR